MMTRDLRSVALSFSLTVGLCGLVTGEETPPVQAQPAQDNSAATRKAEKKELKPIEDPIRLQISEFQKATREKFIDGSFDDLEKLAAQLRAGKETFGNGSWKICEFYMAFGCGDGDPESVWLQHERIYKDWIAAKPDSETAKIAYADFLTDYAWKARGDGYADSVTQEGWKLFKGRLAAASEVLKEATKSPEKDPMLGEVFLTVALGQAWSKAVYDVMMEKFHKEEPTFWGYDVARSISLMPRWHGEEGDWEAFAEEAAALPKGLGDETYARIVIGQQGYYRNIFQETKASWPKTRNGLEILRKKYPESLEMVNHTALLAALAGDRALAKEMFDRMGDTYVSSFWSADRFKRFRTWAETGKR